MDEVTLRLMAQSDTLARARNLFKSDSLILELMKQNTELVERSDWISLRHDLALVVCVLMVCATAVFLFKLGSKPSR